MSRLLLLLVATLCVLSPAMPDDTTPAKADTTTPLPIAMGAWPQTAHNAPFRVHTLWPGGSTVDLPLTGHDATLAVYAVLGAPAADHKSFARTSADGLLLGGERPGQSATVVWCFEAPAGMHFTGGRAIARAPRQGPHGDAGVSLGIGTDFIPLGGGDFWKPISGLSPAGIRYSAFTPALDGGLVASQAIPPHSRRLYLAVSRRAGVSTRFALSELRLEATLSHDQGLQITVPRPEPIWTQDEPITLQIDAAAMPDADLPYRLLTESGDPVETGRLRLPAARTPLDLSGLQPGFYTLEIPYPTDDGPFTARQSIAVLRAVDPARTARSIDGALGTPHRAGSHGSMGQPDAADLDLLRLMGVRWVVSSALWAWSQESADAPISRHDADAAIAIADAGFEPILSFGTAPRWANGNRPGAAPPDADHLPHWQRYSQEIARATRGRVHWFQTWNEPNNPHALWQPPPWDLERRAAVAKNLQRHQYDGLIAGNPDARLIGGNFAGMPDDWFALWLADPLSIARHQHAMSGHPYCRVTRENNWAHDRPAEPDLVPRLLASRAAMDAAGAADQPIFLTEYGWYTPKTSPADQARWTARQQTIVRAYRLRTRIAAHCIFSPGDMKNGHNLLRPPIAIRPGEHRLLPVIAAYTTNAALLADTLPATPILDHPSPTRAYRFSRDGRHTTVAWTTEAAPPDTPTALPLVDTPRTLLRIDAMGAESLITLHPDQPFIPPADHSPVYLQTADTPTLHALPSRLLISPDTPAATLTIANIGPGSLPIRISADVPWLILPDRPLSAHAGQPIALPIRASAHAPADGQATLTISSGDQSSRIHIRRQR